MAVKKKKVEKFKKVAKVGPISKAIQELAEKRSQTERHFAQLVTEPEKLMYLAMFRAAAALHMRDQVAARQILDEASREIHVKYTYIAQTAFDMTVDKR